MKNDASKYFLNAVQKLNQANKELYKPEEDVVSYLVCKNSQFAIENYLKGYLIKNGIDPSSFKTINSLYEQCLRLNKNFENIDLSDFECKSRAFDSTYCNKVAKVSCCFDIADSIDTLLKREKVI